MNRFNLDPTHCLDYGVDNAFPSADVCTVENF
jgi:hypothetical protein